MSLIRSLLKILIIISILVAIIYFGRSFLPDGIRLGVLYPVEKQIVKLERKLGLKTDEYVIKDGGVNVIDGNILREIMTSLSQSNKKTLIYIYSLDCTLCRANFYHINNMAKQYKPLGLSVFALAIEESATKLVDFFDERDIYFTPYMIKPDSANSILQILGKYEGKYKTPGYVGVMWGYAIRANIETGAGQRRVIENAIKDALGIGGY